MGFLDVFKALIAPALIALALYALGAYVLVPLYRRHHARYSQYLPLDTLSSHTSRARSRLGHTLSHYLLPNSLRWSRRQGDVVDGRRGSLSGSAGGEDQWVLEDDEGERMVGFGQDVSRFERGRDERGGRIRVVGGPREEIDSQRRLSRDLEEGFKDDSESDGDDRAVVGGRR
ncbi:hypothetical protein LTR53_016061 [Teratosphaeriaceae sp. CCFEE 6253]|nr:hypothetical protein LTR53_016061 [Teratosphaeriaceae sp. CCFEE 6253]